MKIQTRKGLCLPNASEFYDGGKLKKTILASHRTIMSVMKQFSLSLPRFFAGHCPMSGANIQVCYMQVSSSVFA